MGDDHLALRRNDDRMHPNQPQPVPFPPYPPLPAAPTTSGLAVASLVLGIVGLFTGCCTFGIPCVLAVIFGHLGMAATKDGRQTGRGAAVAGLVLGYVVVVPAIVITFMGGVGSILEGAKPKPNAEITACSINDANRTAAVNFTVTNRSKTDDSYQVTVDILNSSGVRVGDGTGYVSNVPAGQSAAGTATAYLDVAGGSTCKVSRVS